jgi:signal recognition particle subunit SRP54
MIKKMGNKNLFKNMAQMGAGGPGPSGRMHPSQMAKMQSQMAKMMPPGLMNQMGGAGGLQGMMESLGGSGGLQNLMSSMMGGAGAPDMSQLANMFGGAPGRTQAPPSRRQRKKG